MDLPELIQRYWRAARLERQTKELADEPTRRKEMACPTCDHMMESIRVGVFWCPRCGSLKLDLGLGIQDLSPKLVGRCREFQLKVIEQTGDFETMGEWRRLGIAESLQTKGETNV